MDTLIHNYNYYVHELSDKRVHNWPLMSSPWGLICVITVYLLLVYNILPRYMANREPYSLKRIIMGYNIFQVIACASIIYQMGSATVDKRLNFGCQPVDYSQNQAALKLASMSWWTVMLKLMELIETCFFVLRKKSNQVSALHVYHHISTLSLGWMVAKYYPGGMITFIILINCVVHVFMYSYYLLASLGLKWQKITAPLKPKLTMIQMIQFVLLAIHSTYAFSPNCNISKFPFILFMPDLALLFFMFYNFYQKSYRVARKIK